MQPPVALTQNEIDRIATTSAKSQAGINCYDIALVLGGTVSAGAYTAGVIDFLIEALDAWDTAKAQDQAANILTVPQHSVKIKVITGASGGGVNAAILGRCLPYRYQHAKPGLNNRLLANNPFYDLWVNRLDLKALCSVSEFDDSNTVSSLLCAQPLDQGAKLIAQFGKGLDAVNRSYVDPTLHMILTLTNLRGITYRTDLTGGGPGFHVIDHGDYVRFALPTRTDIPASPLWRDEFTVLSAPQTMSDIGWEDFSLFARATGAFPAGFPARKLHRPMEFLRYRVRAIPGDVNRYDIRQLEPDWQRFSDSAGSLPETYDFVSVDGGAINNEPIELARTALCGLLGRNPRSGDKANAGVILIDPLAAAPALGTDSITERLLPVLGQTVGALKDQARYSTADLLLALNNNVFSRFTVAPQRTTGSTEVVGERAITGAALGGFFGFFDARLREHDFRLGRYNCQKFLKETFVLDHLNNDGNINSGKVFRAADVNSGGYAGWRQVNTGGTMTFPVVPLVGSAAKTLDQPTWPKNVIDQDGILSLLRQRLYAVVERLTDEFINTWKPIDWAIDQGLTDKAIDIINKKISEARKDWEL